MKAEKHIDCDEVAFEDDTKNIDKTWCSPCWPCSLLALCLEFDISPHLEFVLVVVVVIGGQRNASLEFPFQLGKGSLFFPQVPHADVSPPPKKPEPRHQNPHLNHRSTANDPACWEHQPFVASCQGKTRRFPCLFYGGGRHESFDSPWESSGKMRWIMACSHCKKSKQRAICVDQR